ncbi:MAG TPA: retropepsin-like aspartic protease [Sphingomicrobium sp.]|nr:retropepsin-like aspartic protease [Sphingomicrobium sp.]
MGEIVWRHSGQRLRLPVAVLPSAAAQNSLAIEVIDALVDTGATGTGLRPDVAKALDVPGRGKRRVMTANGDILVPEYRIRLGFFCGEFQNDPEPHGSPYVLDFGLLVHALRENFSYQMLIGMDVLSRCDLILLKDRTATIRLP